MQALSKNLSYLTDSLFPPPPTIRIARLPPKHLHNPVQPLALQEVRDSGLLMLVEVHQYLHRADRFLQCAHSVNFAHGIIRFFGVYIVIVSMLIIAMLEIRVETVHGAYPQISYPFIMPHSCNAYSDLEIPGNSGSARTWPSSIAFTRNWTRMYSGYSSTVSMENILLSSSSEIR